MEWLFIRLLCNDLPVTERIMNCTDIKTSNKFSYIITVVRFTSPHCGNHSGQDAFGLQAKSLSWLIQKKEFIGF